MTSLVAVFTTLALTVPGPIGSMKLDLGHFSAGLSSQKSEAGDVTGNIYGLANASGKIEFAKQEDGSWKGHYGFYQVRTKPPVKKGDKLRIEVRVLPTGFFTFYVEDKGDRVNVSAWHPNGGNISSQVKEDDYSAHNPYLSINMSHDEDPCDYEGTAQQWPGGESPSASASLKCHGDLDPKVLAKADPTLYILLYVLPFNLYR